MVFRLIQIRRVPYRPPLEIVDFLQANSVKALKENVYYISDLMCNGVFWQIIFES